MELYDRNDMERMRWPDTEDGQYACRYWLPLMRGGTEAYIHNVRTRCMLAKVNDRVVVPLTVNDGEYNNSYVCSPYTHYVTYTLQELALLKSPGLEVALRAVLRSMGLWLRMGRINQVVHLNNWLVSTNLYPALTAEEVSLLTARLREAFPAHALVFRSVNPGTDPVLYEALLREGYKMIGSRQVYELDTVHPESLPSKARWLLKRDGKLLEQSGYEVIGSEDLGPDDVPRMAELYNALYLDKYSRCNPQFTEHYFATTLREGTLRYHVLRKQGKIDAVLGYFTRNGVMTTPIFGYDTSLPMETGLYRMLSVVLVREAERQGLLLNESSGAAGFKRCRGAVPRIEYTVVYDKHLPATRRMRWTVLADITHRWGVPIMQKRKL
ncbi:GNAT family N-acetyltransferase [Paenibacillus sp. J2TS4]|uniref:GNAT family N-acetyltransferase n=1 Tax=Paenibacillus sp. J2TS4 TaxID=2807194 RepID=UPI0020BED4CF|nr:GNAT family N-acetyltransferase [Paenibacillus sp. J2TS4]